MTYEEELDAQYRVYDALKGFDTAGRDRAIRAVQDRFSRERAPLRLAYPSQPNPEALEAMLTMDHGGVGHVPDDAA